jgi:hypothetical protein
VKTPEQITAEVVVRLRRSWAEVVDPATLDETSAPTGGSGSSTVWPHAFSLSAPRGAALSRDFAAVQELSLAWRRWYDDHGGRGIDLVTADRLVNRTRQSIPTHLRLADADAAARLCGDEWTGRLTRGRHRAETLVAHFGPRPHLPRLLRTVDGWSDLDFALLIQAGAWFRDHDATGLTPRMVPIPGMHAKWLNTRRDLVANLAGLTELPLTTAHPPRVHLTYLDPGHRAAGGRHHDCVSLGDQVTLPYKPTTVVISENKDTAIAFPPVPAGVAVEGNGQAAAKAAAQLPWLVRAPILAYWGDIDAEGFEILDLFRANGLPAASLLMDQATMNRYGQFGTSHDRHGNPIAPRTPRDLAHLTNDERALYDAITGPDWDGHRRLEQERIPLTDALAALKTLVEST